MADQSQKTEKATPRRIQKARDEGHFPTARQFVASLQFLVAVALVTGGVRRWILDLGMLTRDLIQRGFGAELSRGELAELSRGLVWGSCSSLVTGGSVLVVAGALIQLAVTGGGLTLKKVAPEINRLNPMSRVRELVRQNVFALLQALVLIPLSLYAVFEIGKDNLETYLRLPLTSVWAAVGTAAGSFESLLWKAAAGFLVFGLVELVRERRHYLKELRMSKQELRDEIKETEGNPQVRARIRRLQRDMARRHMMKRVPQATAVVVNPTHFAVALHYDLDSMPAPKVIAKGLDHVAARIRVIAVQNSVPIVENPPLARALYQSVDIGQEIPVHLYRAVAEVLAYVHMLTYGKAPATP